MPISDEVKKYREKNNCSIQEAYRAITRLDFCKELRNDKMIYDVTDTIIRILNFEFGGYEG